MSTTLTDPRDLFATDEHAAQHPAVYGRRSAYPIAPESIATGEANAVVNAARKRALQRGFPRFKRAAKGSTR